MTKTGLRGKLQEQEAPFEVDQESSPKKFDIDVVEVTVVLQVDRFLRYLDSRDPKELVLEKDKTIVIIESIELLWDMLGYGDQSNGQPYHIF